MNAQVGDRLFIAPAYSDICSCDYDVSVMSCIVCFQGGVGLCWAQPYVYHRYIIWLLSARRTFDTLHGETRTKAHVRDCWRQSLSSPVVSSTGFTLNTYSLTFCLTHSCNLRYHLLWHWNIAPLHAQWHLARNWTNAFNRRHYWWYKRHYMGDFSVAPPQICL